MKEPTGKIWLTTMAFYWMTTVVIGHFTGKALSWHSALNAFESSVAYATVVWLIALARWNRAILKG